MQKALSLDLSPYEGEKPHLVVVRFILKRGQTNVEIEIREFEGGGELMTKYNVCFVYK